jgi:hypothetical protein
MASWLVPALKAMLPHLGDLVSVAKPHFTRKKPETDQVALVQEQIGELQAAVSQNATHLQELALQLQRTVAALEQAAASAERRLRAAFVLSLVAAAFSVTSLSLAIFLAYFR